MLRERIAGRFGRGAGNLPDRSSRNRHSGIDRRAQRGDLIVAQRESLVCPTSARCDEDESAGWIDAIEPRLAVLTCNGPRGLDEAQPFSECRRDRHQALGAIERDRRLDRLRAHAMRKRCNRNRCNRCNRGAGEDGKSHR